MSYKSNPPICNVCNGIGVTFEDVDSIEENASFPFIEECSLCEGSGINRQSYNIKKHRGEIIHYSGSLAGMPRVAIFMKEISYNYSQILIGKRLITVPNDDITFLNLFRTKINCSMFDKKYKQNIYELLGII